MTLQLDLGARRRLLEAGVLAPSGDNLQPWIARWDGDRLQLSVDSSRDRSLYNFRFRASLIALGAMTENIALAASEFGVTTKVSLSTAGPEDLPSAVLDFESGAGAPDALAPFLSRRCTNRKPYRTAPLKADVLDALREAVPADTQARLAFVTDPEQRRVLARAASLNDRLLFELRELHDVFFECMRWTEAEAAATRDGLFIKTLELGPMAAGFKAMRSWRVVRLANLLGSSRTAPFHSYRTFLRSPAFGFLQMADVSPRAFVEGGRVLQRVWLAATAQGLGFQPMAGMLYLLAYLQPESGIALDADRRALLEKAGGLFKQVLPLEAGKASIMLFRIGYGAAPSATSLRRPIQVAG